MKKSNNSNPLKYFNDAFDKRKAGLKKAQEGIITTPSSQYVQTGEGPGYVSFWPIERILKENSSKSSSAPIKEKVKGPKGVIPGTSTSKSTYTDKDSKPVYTDTSRPNEYFTMTKTKAGQDSLAPYNAQMGLYGNPTKKSGGQTKTKKK